jgi:hypothetical protein
MEPLMQPPLQFANIVLTERIEEHLKFQPLSRVHLITFSALIQGHCCAAATAGVAFPVRTPDTRITVMH